MKALVVRLSAIGDVVHTLPVASALRQHGWETGWLVEPPALPLLRGSPMVSEVVPAPSARAFRLRAARMALRELRQSQYDLALDMQGLWKSAAWARLSGAGRVLGYGKAWRREPASALLLRERVELPGEATHVIDKNLALLRPLGIDALGCREFALPPTMVEAVEVERRLSEMGPGDFALLNPGGGWTSKLWPPHRFGELARGLRQRGLASLVSWGPGEQALADQVVAASDGAAIRCFPTTLLEYVELARRARVVVAADTGPLHLAAAIGATLVALFGPTDPARNGPFSPHDVVVRRVPVCAPCHRRRCPAHEGVMEGITAEEVVRAIERRLAGRTAAHAARRTADCGARRS